MNWPGASTIESSRTGAPNYTNISENALLASSHEITGGLNQTDFVVPGMHCIGCIRTIEKVIGELPYVNKVRANLSLKKVSVVWQSGTGNIVAIDKAIGDAGFDHSAFDLNTDDDGAEARASKRLLMALAVAGFAALNIMLLSVSVWSGADLETTRLFHLISGVIAVPAVYYSGQPFFQSAVAALKVRRLNMDVPISLAVLLALMMSLYESLVGGSEAYFDAAVTLLFFLLIGRYLDNLMREKARSSIVQLSKLSAKGAMMVGENGNLSYLQLGEIKPGMIVRVMAGERVPVDGEVIKGQSDIDRSLVTGESVPQLAKNRSQVEAGTLNLSGAIDIRVARDAGHSFLAEVTRMMEAAEQGRGHFTRVADRMAQIYAPTVHMLAALAFIGWMIATGGDWHTSIYIAISVLIITCPCALGLAVPVVHVIAARRLFKEGIIIRDGSGFERLEQVDHVLFDKTGTLTNNVPTVKSSDIKDQKQSAIAKTLASHSSHPFSIAVAGFIKSAPSLEVLNITEIPGVGIEGMVRGKLARLGRAKWVGEIVAISDDTHQYESELCFAVAGERIARFEVAEELRKDAAVCVAELKSFGADLEILSGDGRRAVERVADELAIDNFYYNQRPGDKIDHINVLKGQGAKVLMVGDGLNDSPAMAAADVSIAPANASDIARQAADFVFTRQSLNAVPFAIKIANRAGKLVRQNFTLAIAYNSIAIPFALAGAITPLVAAVAMSASSIVVVANSMRLNADKIGGYSRNQSSGVFPDQDSDESLNPLGNSEPGSNINERLA